MGAKDCCLKICPCCKDKNPHLVFAIVGLSISASEIVLASVYNFHMCGFALALIGVFLSGFYLFFSLRAYQEK